jgi:hypothetical protein
MTSLNGVPAPVLPRADRVAVLTSFPVLAGSNTIKSYVNGQALASTIPSIKVLTGPMSFQKSTVTLTASTMKAGGEVTVAVQPEDAGGNKLIEPGESVTFSSQSGRGKFGPLTFNSKTGAYSETFTSTVASPETIAIDVNHQPLNSMPTLTVTPAPASLAKSLVNLSNNTVASGDSIVVALQAQDAYGNPETSGGLAVAFRLSGGTGGQGKFSTVTDHRNGTYTATFAGTRVGSNLIVATIGGARVTSTAPTVIVTPGMYSLANTISVSYLSVAVGKSVTVSLQTRDSAGNDLATNLLAEGIPISFELGTPTGHEGTLSSAIYAGNGKYTATFTASRLERTRSWRRSARVR